MLNILEHICIYLNNCVSSSPLKPCKGVYSTNRAQVKNLFYYLVIELERQYTTCLKIFQYTSNGFPYVFEFLTAYSRRSVPYQIVNHNLVNGRFLKPLKILINKNCGLYRWKCFDKLQTNDHKDFEMCIKNLLYVTQQYVSVTLVPVYGSYLHTPWEFVFPFI